MMQILQTIGHYTLLAYGLTVITWVLYLAVMNLARNRNKLSPIAKYMFAYPVLLAGYLADSLLNITVASVVFVELPKEMLLTDRCQRHLNKGGYRGDVARFLCTHLLNPFDPDGKHC